MSTVAIRARERTDHRDGVRLHRIALVVLLGIAAWHGGRAAWIEAKAQLAQRLMLRAWSSSQGGGGDARPWPWADTHPVARLTVPRLGVDQLVLAGPAAARWPSVPVT